MAIVTLNNDTFPDADAVIERIVLFYLGEAIRKAEKIVEAGDHTMRGALRGMPYHEKKVFIDTDAMQLIAVLMSWPHPIQWRHLERSGKLRKKILDILDDCPEAEVLTANNLTVEVKLDGIDGASKAYICEMDPPA